MMTTMIQAMKMTTEQCMVLTTIEISTMLTMTKSDESMTVGSRTVSFDLGNGIILYSIFSLLKI